MDTMVPTRPTLLPSVLRRRRISLPAQPAAAGEARRQVQGAIHAWEVPVDSSIAVLLTSELVTNAIRHAMCETITLDITCGWGQLHVDVHDSSCAVPVPLDRPADAETGRGLVLVASLSTAWGYYHTPVGKAVYFTLAFSGDPDEGTGPRAVRTVTGDS